MQPAFEGRPSRAPEAKPTPKEEPEIELSLSDIEWVETQEATKLRTQETQRAVLREAYMEEGLRKLVHGLGRSEADRRRLQKRDRLRTQEPRGRHRPENPGANSTERWILDDPTNPTEDAFAKRQSGELVLLYDAAKKQAYEARMAIGTDGRMHTNYKSVSARSEAGKKAEADYLNRERVSKAMGETHGVEAAKLLHPQELALRWVEQGHATRAEVASSVLNDLVGLDVIPETVLRKDKGDLVSVQERAAGTPITDEKFQSFLEHGDEQPGATSMMQLACMDYLLMSSDRHSNNLFYDEKTQAFKGIDNGYTLGRSVKKRVRVRNATTGTWEKREEYLPADSYGSVPMQFVNMNKGWKLDEEARAKFSAVYDAVVQYARFREGQLSKEEVDALPEAVREGLAATLISDTFRFLHERKGTDGKTDPDSTSIAKLEAHLFLRRLKQLVDHGRPPNWALSD